MGLGPIRRRRRRRRRWLRSCGSSPVARVLGCNTMGGNFQIAKPSSVLHSRDEDEDEDEDDDDQRDPLSVSHAER